MSARIRILLLVAPLTGAAWCSERGALGARTLANACGDSAAILWEPVGPRPGALFRVRFSGAPEGAVLAGAVAGEALHFGALPAVQAAESFAAVPIDAADSLEI